MDRSRTKYTEDTEYLFVRPHLEATVGRCENLAKLRSTCTDEAIDISFSETSKQVVRQQLVEGRVRSEGSHAEIILMMGVESLVPQVAGVIEAIERLEKFQALLGSLLELWHGLGDEQLS